MGHEWEMFIEWMAIVLASRIHVLVGKTVGKITNHRNVRGALGNLCTTFYGNMKAEGMSHVGVPDGGSGNTKSSSLQISDKRWLNYLEHTLKNYWLFVLKFEFNWHPTFYLTRNQGMFTAELILQWSWTRMCEKWAKWSKDRMKRIHGTQSWEPFPVQRGAVAAGVEWLQGRLGGG